ncbi:MAG TPA: cupin domain-containing protein [Candidatus Tumulicola sp.]
MHAEAERLIGALELKPHPEGGFYCETYRSDIRIATSDGARNAITSIYYLLADEMYSAFHRLKSDEIWHHHRGSPVSIEIIESDGRHREIVIGTGDCWQAAIGAGAWFAARLSDPESYALVGADVAPGFKFEDFEMGRREELVAAFPQHKALIERLTRS